MLGTISKVLTAVQGAETGCLLIHLSSLPNGRCLAMYFFKQRQVHPVKQEVGSQD
jgi:hypothetical protein